MLFAVEDDIGTEGADWKRTFTRRLSSVALRAAVHALGRDTGLELLCGLATPPLSHGTDGTSDGVQIAVELDHFAGVPVVALHGQGRLGRGGRRVGPPRETGRPSGG
jgi:hypothetical protein